MELHSEVKPKELCVKYFDNAVTCPVSRILNQICVGCRGICGSVELFPVESRGSYSGKRFGSRRHGDGRCAKRNMHHQCDGIQVPVVNS